MEMTEPKPKHKCKLKRSAALPIIEKPGNKIHTFSAIFNGFAVVVSGDNDMKNLVSMGYFGKANLSRTYPQFNQRRPEIIRRRTFQYRTKISANLKNKPEKVIVVPNSDSDDDDYFTNLKPQYEIDKSLIKEKVHLSMEESFFLLENIKCLTIYHKEKKMDAQEAWNVFKQCDKYFVQNYITYYHFRTKKWVVTTGIKFGGDFLLYKQGPPFYHASYVVIIDVVDVNFRRIEINNRRSMNIVNLMSMNRLCETAGKELLICEIIWPQDIKEVCFTDLPRFVVKEIIMTRWISSQER